MRQVSAGFTLIELMIVVTVISILSMFALPTYQTYTKRSHVAEGIVLAASAKFALTEYYIMTGGWPEMTANGHYNQLLGLADPAHITGKAVKSITVKGDASSGVAKNRIEVEYNQKVADGAILILGVLNDTDVQGMSGSIRWGCWPKNDALKIKWIPSSCEKSETVKKK